MRESPIKAIFLHGEYGGEGMRENEGARGDRDGGAREKWGREGEILVEWDGEKKGEIEGGKWERERRVCGYGDGRDMA